MTLQSLEERLKQIDGQLQQQASFVTQVTAQFNQLMGAKSEILNQIEILKNPPPSTEPPKTPPTEPLKTPAKAA